MTSIWNTIFKVNKLITIGITIMMIVVTSLFFITYTNLTYTERISTEQHQLRFLLTHLDSLNTSITYILRNEKPFVIAKNKNKIAEIEFGKNLALRQMNILKKTSASYPQIHALMLEMEKAIHDELANSDSIIAFSLGGHPDSAVNYILKNDDSLYIVRFYNSYNYTYYTCRNKLEANTENNTINSKNVFISFIWLGLTILISFIFIIYRLITQAVSKDDLIKQNKLFAYIFKQTSEAVIITNKDGIVRFANQAAGDLYSKEISDLIGQNLNDIFELKNNESIINGINSNNTKTGLTKPYLTQRDTNGKLLYLKLNTSELFDDDGKPSGYAIIINNITDLTTSEILLSQKTKELQSLNQQLEEKINTQTKIIKETYERLSDGFFSTDQNFNIIYISNAMEILLRSKKITSIIGQIFFDVIKNFTETDIESPIRASFNKQNNIKLELYNSLESKCYLLSVFPSFNAISFHLSDITEAKRTEFEIKKSKRLYEFISSANDLAINAQNEEELYQQFCSLAIDKGGFLFAWIGFANEHTQNIVVSASAGKEDGYLDIVKTISAKSTIPEGRGPSGIAMRTGKFVYTNDIANDEAMKPWAAEALKRGYQSSIALPIKLRGKVSGIFTLYSGSPFYFTNEEVTLLEKVTENISLALNAFSLNRKRRKAEFELRKISAAVEQSSASIVITDKNGLIEYVNPAFLKLTGYSSEEVIGKNPRILKTGYTNEQEYKQLWQDISNNKTWSGIFKNKKKNGEVYWENASISPIIDKNGFITNYLAIKEDITAKLQMQEEQKKLLNIIEHTLAYVGIVDYTTKKFIYVNNALKNILEIKEDEDITALSAIDFKFPNNKEITQAHYDNIKTDSSYITENILKSRSGKKIYIYQVSTLVITKDGSKQIVTTAIDISKTKEAQQNIIELNDIVENALAYISKFDLNGKLIYMNKSMKKLLGFSEEDDINDLNVSSIVASGIPKSIAESETLMKTGTWIGENVYKTKSGEEIPVLQTIFLHKDEEGQPSHYSSTSLNLSNIKKAETDILNANNELRYFAKHIQEIAETEKREIAREIHDELGQYLTALKFTIVLTRKHIHDADFNLDKRMNEMADQVNQLIAAFRKIHTALHPAMLEEVGLYAATEWIINNFRNKTGINTAFSSNIDGIIFEFDKSLILYRILQESLTNIMRYASANNVDISLTIDEKTLTLIIKDDGIGFDVAKVDATTHHGILGMRERIYAANGKFEIKSVINKGTTILAEIYHIEEAKK